MHISVVLSLLLAAHANVMLCDLVLRYTVSEGFVAKLQSSNRTAGKRSKRV